MRYNREWAVEAVKQGVHVLVFYGHVQRGETVDASCLSQWFPCSFVTEGNIYTTAEQYMMAEKARLFGDEGDPAADPPGGGPHGLQTPGPPGPAV